MHILDFKKVMVFLLYLLIITNCGKITESPKKVVSKFLEARMNWDFKEAYNYISSEDKKVKSLKDYKERMEFLDEISSSDTSIISLIKDRTSYKVKKVNVNDDKAIAKVESKSPDFSSMASEFLGEAFISAFSGDTSFQKMQDRMAKRIVEKYKDKEMPMTTTTTTYNLIKEKDGWKIFFDWKTQKQTDSLKSLAEQFEEKKEFGKAIETYREVGKIDSNTYKEINAREKINKLDEEFRKFEEKRKYIDKIEIKGIKLIKKEIMLIKWRVIGELKNRSDKTLNEVEVTVYCLDKNGNAVSEFKRYPVLVSRYSIGNKTPLRPNYSRKFELSIDNPPSDWAKKVRVEVTDIEFAE